MRPGAADHAVFGRCDAVSLDDGGEVLARFAAVDWDDPAFIPPLDRPGALPSGAGTAILNEIARRTSRAHLRYRGPYPTGALFDALCECFRPAGEPADAFARFTAGVEEAAFAAEMREAAVDFAPAPFERSWREGGVCVQRRDGVEKIFVRGRAYARDAAGARRVRPTSDGGWVARVEISGAPWADVVTLDADGHVIDGPNPLPPVTSAAAGTAISDAVCSAVAAQVAAASPAVLRRALAEVVASTPMRWGDPGDAAATIEAGAVVVHAEILERAADTGPQALLATLAEAAAPHLLRLAQARLSSLVDPEG